MINFYLDYNNADFESVRNMLNDEFNNTLNNFVDVNDQLQSLC